MATTVVNLTCRGCGYPIAADATECPAGHPVTISTFNSVASMPAPMVNKYANSYKQDLTAAPNDQGLNNSIGICWLKLKLYDRALPAFEKAMADNFDNSESYFYAAICLLGGKKAFVAQRATIDKAIEYLNAAIMIEPKGVYHLLLAYIKYDYHKRKFLKVSPTHDAELVSAKKAGLSRYDTDQLFTILGVENPFSL